MDLRQIRIVARFELQDALRSRLVLAVVLLYGVGAGLGCYFFFQALAAAEMQVRESMIVAGTPVADLPHEFIRKQALPRIIASVVDNEALAKQLVAVDPLALFYAWGAFLFATPLALITSAGTHARDREHGTVRFLLTRTDRGSWALGKLLGHGALSGLGIGLGACVTVAIAGVLGSLTPGTLGWLAAASARAWVYAGAFLCLFSGVSQVARSAARARAGCAVLLFLLWLGHTLVSANSDEGLSLWVWLFPGHYKALLWSPGWGDLLTATVGLLVLGAGAFLAGLFFFRRQDT